MPGGGLHSFNCSCSDLSDWNSSSIVTLHSNVENGLPSRRYRDQSDGCLHTFLLGQIGHVGSSPVAITVENCSICMQNSSSHDCVQENTVAASRDFGVSTDWISSREVGSTDCR